MQRRRTAAVVVLSLLVGGGVTLLVGPRPPSLAASSASSDTGDAALAERVREVFGDAKGQRGLAVALVDADGEATFAGVGASGDPGRPQVDEDTRFEIGSVTKGLTGLLIAEQVERGETSLDERIGGATLADLATHRSGLPRVPLSTLPAQYVSNLTGGDPYSGDAASVLAVARDHDPGGGAKPVYSNLGAAAAGDLVARRAGVPYPDLLRERVLDPLGMDATTVATGPDGLPSPRAAGSTTSGNARAPWVAQGWAPAGVGPWSTASDMAQLVAALADGTAPGVEAARPRTAYTGDREIGLFWITSEHQGHTVTSHSGGTGGFKSFVGFEPATGRGVVVLANTTAGVDRQALELLLDGAS